MKRTYLLTLALGLLATTIVAPKLFHSPPKAAEQASTIQAYGIPTSALSEELAVKEGSRLHVDQKSEQTLHFEPIGTVTVFSWVSNEPDCQGNPGDKFHRGDETCTYGTKVVALSFKDKKLGYVGVYNPSDYAITVK